MRRLVPTPAGTGPPLWELATAGPFPAEGFFVSRNMRRSEFGFDPHRTFGLHKSQMLKARQKNRRSTEEHINRGHHLGRHVPACGTLAGETPSRMPATSRKSRPSDGKMASVQMSNADPSGEEDRDGVFETFLKLSIVR